MDLMLQPHLLFPLVKESTDKKKPKPSILRTQFGFSISRHLNLTSVSTASLRYKIAHRKEPSSCCKWKFIKQAAIRKDVYKADHLSIISS